MKTTTVSDVFSVRYGHSLELNRLSFSDGDKGIAFVSRKMGDNGVSAFVVRIPGLQPASAGELTVALGGNGVLSTFLQDRPFYTGRDVAILHPKNSMPKTTLLYYCMCIKANRYRHSYGRQANRSLRALVIPDPTDLPSWVPAANVDMFEGADAAIADTPVVLKSLSTWKAFKLQELFDIRKGKRLTKASMTSGVTPFIGSTDSHNGVTALVGQRPNHSGNTITVAYNGSVAETFYQPIPFWATDDVNVLYPKFAMTPTIALFVITLIKCEKYRYNYGRKWHLERMAVSSILLPVKSDDTPDWGFMKRYIQSLPYSSQIEQDNSDSHGE